MSGALLVLIVSLALGLAALFAFGWRLFGQVRSLGRVVAASSERLATAAETLSETEAALSRPTGEG